MRPSTELIPAFDEQDVGDVVVLNESASDRDAGDTTAKDDNVGRRGCRIVAVKGNTMGEDGGDKE